MREDMVHLDLSSQELLRLRDKDGYIILDKLNLTDESREKMGNEHRIKNWIVTKDEKQYMVKTNAVLDDIPNYTNYAELIAMKIAEQVGIEYAKYDLAKINGMPGIITENVLDEYEYLVTLEDLINGSISSPDNEDIIEYLDVQRQLQIYLREYGFDEEDIQDVLTELNKRFILDIIIGATDRHTENISFILNIKDNTKIRLAPVYDSENSLLLENNIEILENIAGDMSVCKELAKNCYPKIALVSDKEANMLDITLATFARSMDNPEVEDFAFDALYDIDIYDAMDSVEEQVGTKLPLTLRAIVSTFIESRIELLKDFMDGEIDLKYNKDYLKSIKSKTEQLRNLNNKVETKKYVVKFEETIIGTYSSVNEEKIEYKVEQESIKELEKKGYKLFTLLTKNNEGKSIAFFESRIRNCSRFKGRIKYHTDSIELVKI